MTSRIIALATTLLLTCAATSANITAALDSLFLERYGGHASEPGGAVIVARGDSVLYERYFGMADLPSQTPVSAKTLFCLASVSKQFTVAGLLQLAEQGRIDIEAPSSRYLPYKAALWDTVTLADLAGHTSGIADTRDRSNRDSCIYATDATSVHFFDDVVATQFPPGTAYDYLNPSFLLLAKVIENVSGEEFTAYQRRHVFSPAGMTNALYFSPDSMPATAAHGYAPDGNGGWNEYDYGEETFYATRPDGCLYATARDILAWERALASGKVLGDSLLHKAYAPRVSVTDSKFCDYQRRPNTWYGLGWFVDTTPGEPVKVYHPGDNGGFQASVAKRPEDNVCVIVLENRHDRDRWTMARAIDAILAREL